MSAENNDHSYAHRRIDRGYGKVCDLICEHLAGEHRVADEEMLDRGADELEELHQERHRAVDPVPTVAELTGAAPGLQEAEVDPALVGIVGTVGELARLKDLLSDVATSGVSFEDPRIDYLEVQIDRGTWNAIQAWKQGREQ